MKIKSKPACIFLLVFSSLFQQSALSSEAKKYSNDHLGFEVSYLDKWETASAPSNPALFIKRESSVDPATLLIAVANFTGNKKQLMQELRDKPELFAIKFKRKFPDTELVGHRNANLAGVPAYVIDVKFTAETPSDNIVLRSMSLICIQNKKLYLIQFEAPQSVFENILAEVQSILTTFRFL